MKITFHREGLKKALARAGTSAAGAGEAACGGAAAVSRRAEDALLYARLRGAVKDLREEIDLQLRDLGELLYDTHRGTPSDSEDMQEILTYIDSLYEEIEGHERQMKALRGVLVCQACGGENAAANVYCQECGRPLTRP